MTELCVRNRQSLQRINLPLFRQIARGLVTDLLPTSAYELGVYLVSSTEMADLNETFLNHSGSTDVITFAYTNNEQMLSGEIFISIEDAIAQAREFATNWPSEIVRYLIHGVLHLKGYNDLSPGERRVMKRRENRLLEQLSAQFALSDLAQVESRSRPHGSSRKKSRA
jgi:probable rRNA maturation factor